MAQGEPAIGLFLLEKLLEACDVLSTECYNYGDEFRP